MVGSKGVALKILTLYVQGGAPPCDPALLFRQKVGKSLLRGSVPLRLPQTSPAEGCSFINDSPLFFTLVPGQKWVGVPLNLPQRKLSYCVPLKNLIQRCVLKKRQVRRHAVGLGFMLRARAKDLGSFFR